MARRHWLADAIESAEGSTEWIGLLTTVAYSDWGSFDRLVGSMELPEARSMIVQLSTALASHLKVYCELTGDDLHEFIRAAAVTFAEEDDDEPDAL